MQYGPSHIPEAHTPTEHLPNREKYTLAGHEGPVLAVRLNVQGTYLLSCGKDRTIRLWNPHRGVAIKTYTGHGYDVRDAAVVKDNSKFFSCGGDRQIFLWDVASGNIIRKFRGHDGTVNSLSCGAEDSVLASGGYDSMVKVWDLRSRSFDAIQSIKAAADSITTVKMTDRSEILCSSVDGTVRRFDIRMGRLYTDQLFHPVSSIALSHDGECVLAACMDGGMRLLDRGGGDLLATYTGHVHKDYRLECCFTPSDAYVVAASENGSVFYYELVEGVLVDVVSAHAGVVCSLAMHPQGSCLVTSSVDGIIKVWQ